METKINLATRLLSVMSEMGSITKEGYNDFNKYAYVKESDIVKKLQPILIKNGIFITSSMDEVTTKEIINQKRNTAFFVRVKVTYTIIDATTGETLTCIAYGDGLDTGDKALYKASTGAHKYFLIRQFNLGSDEDAEKESPEVGNPVVKPVGKAPVQPQAKSSDFF